VLAPWMNIKMKITKRQLRRIIRESMPAWMIYQIKKKEEEDARKAEQGRRLPLHRPPPPPPPIDDPRDGDGDDDVDFTLKAEQAEKILRALIRESLALDIEKGDIILTGKFKNKRTTVKDFGTDDLGQPTINGMKLLKFRIEKLMPREKWSKKSKEELELKGGEK